MALSSELYSIKSSGTYTRITDLSQVDIQMTNDRIMPLVVGFADNGPRGCVLPITTYSQFTRYYGSANPKTNDKGNYFHKAAERLLTNGRWIYAMNLAPLNPTNIQNGLFDKSNGYTPNFGYTADADSDKFVKIYNSGKPTHAFIFNSSKNALGYDISVADYYASPSLNPLGKPVPDFITDPTTTTVASFYRSIYVFDGYFDDAFLGSLYGNGYTKIIKPAAKIKVGEIGNTLGTDAVSSPENQKVEIKESKAEYNLGEHRVGYIIENDTCLSQKNIVIPENSPIIITLLDKDTVVPLNEDDSSYKKTKRAGANDVKFEKYSVIIETEINLTTTETTTDPETGESQETTTTTPTPVKLYFQKGVLDGVKLNGTYVDETEGEGETMVITYSDKSKSDEDAPVTGVLTFNSEGWTVIPNVSGTPVYYSVVDNDRIKLPEFMTIQLPKNCILNIDADDTETKLTNTGDVLYVGDYSKILMDEAVKVEVVCGPNTYLTEKGILFEGNPDAGDDEYNGTVKIYGDNLSVKLAYIGDINVQRQDNGQDEVYIDLVAKANHTFNFSDYSDPFIVTVGVGDEYKGKSGKEEPKTVQAPEHTGLEGLQGKVQFPLYATPSDDSFKTDGWLTVTLNLDEDEDSSIDDKCTFSNGWTLDDMSENTITILEANIKALSWSNAFKTDEKIFQGFVLYGGEKAVETLSMVDGSGFIGKYVGFALPDFEDAMGVNQDIKTVFNNDVYLHNMLLGTCLIDETDSFTSCAKTFNPEANMIPLFDTNVLARPLIDSADAEKTTYKLIYGLQGDDLDDMKKRVMSVYDIIPKFELVSPKKICWHSGKKHKLGYGVGVGYNYDYDMLETDSDSKNFNKTLYNCLVDNQYINYRYIVDTLISNGTFLSAEQCVKYNGVTYPASVIDLPISDRYQSIMHWNLFKICSKYGKATALVNAPYPLKDSEDRYTINKECMPGEGDGNWFGTYTSAYKMMNYDSTNAAAISCQGHVYPTAIVEADLCLEKHNSRYPYSVVAGPNYGLVTDRFLTVPAENFTKDDCDHYETIGINLLQYDSNAGTNIKSNQTGKQRVVSALSKFHISELVVYMTIEMQKIMKQLQWEMNTPQIREYLKNKADSFCSAIKNNGGLLSYYNICDSSNNPQEVIDDEMIVLDTGIEPSRAMGKMVNRIRIYKTGGIELSGLA